MKKLLLAFTALLASIAHAADGPKETAQTFFHELFAGDADKADGLGPSQPRRDALGHNGLLGDILDLEINAESFKRNAIQNAKQIVV